MLETYLIVDVEILGERISACSEIAGIWCDDHDGGLLTGSEAFLVDVKRSWVAEHRGSEALFIKELVSGTRR